jgi:hypothetical protein
MVKSEREKDNVWMTFYERLHQHSALMLSLLSSTFNIKENVFKNKSLSSQYFKEQQLANFKDEDSQPHKCLNEIFAKNTNAPMIMSAFYAKGMVPKPFKRDNESTVPDFIEKIIKYSELISDNKKTSADNSISSFLSKVYRKSLQHSKPKDRNHRPGHASNFEHGTIGAVVGPERLDCLARVNWNYNNKFQIIVHMKKQVHKSNMIKCNNYQQAYGWCSLLATDEWNAYIKGQFNENATSVFILKMTNREKFPNNTSPPYEINYKSMTVTVGQKEKGCRRVIKGT